jgi:hypothetical protein
MYCGSYSAGVLHSVSDQIQNLQNCFTTPNKNDSKDAIKGLVSLKFLRPWSQGSSSGAGGGAAAKQVKWFNKCSWTCQICGTTVTTNSSAFFKHVAEHQVSREILWKFNFRILRNGQKTFSK